MPMALLALPTIEDGMGTDENAAECSSSLDCSALAIAARTGHPEMLNGLLRSNADPSLVDSSGRTPLHWAALAGQSDAVNTLLDAGADSTATDGSGKSIAHLACGKAHAAVLEAVLARRPDAVNDVAHGLTPCISRPSETLWRASICYSHQKRI